MSCGRRHTLVTGSSSGLGRAAAQRLAAAGQHVYAGVRNKADGERLVSSADGAEITPVILDITDAGHIATVAGEIAGHTASAGLDGLVNNAGMGLASPVELLPLDTFRRQLEINVVGQLAVTQALLPSLRRARGRIAVVSTIGSGPSPLTTLAWRRQFANGHRGNAWPAAEGQGRPGPVPGQQLLLLVSQVLAPRASRALATIPELTAMMLSDNPASNLPSSTRSSRSGAASPSSRRCRASRAELSASCRARCTPIVVGSVLLMSLPGQVSGRCPLRPSLPLLTARIRSNATGSGPFAVTSRGVTAVTLTCWLSHSLTGHDGLDAASSSQRGSHMATLPPRHGGTDDRHTGADQRLAA